MSIDTASIDWRVGEDSRSKTHYGRASAEALFLFLMALCARAVVGKYGIEALLCQRM